MLSCWDNFLPTSFFKIVPYKFNENVLTYNFLSFQDAFNFLIKKYSLYNKSILIPNFYCNSTVANYKKHLNVIFCDTDREIFDIDYPDFINKLKIEKPQIILIYNYFGKNSILYKNSEWKKYLSGEEIIISDFAHSIYANHNLVFFTEKHFYIDSTRKTTTFMASQIAFSKSVYLDFSTVIGINFYKLNIRILYAIKNLFLYFSVKLKSNFLGNLGCKLFLIHDAKIGNDDNSIKSFWFDSFGYKHINFSKIKKHKEYIFGIYHELFSPICHINNNTKLLFVSKEDRGNMCFFPMHFKNIDVSELILYFQKRGIFIDQLWNFDKTENISEDFKLWAKGVIVFPLNVYTNKKYIKKMAIMLSYFLNHINVRY